MSSDPHIFMAQILRLSASSIVVILIVLLIATAFTKSTEKKQTNRSRR